MMKLDFKRASCRVEFDYFLRGSVLKRTVESGCTAVRTHFEVESDAPAQQVRDLIRNAKQGCFAENMIKTAVPLSSTINLNGEPLQLEGITERLKNIIWLYNGIVKRGNASLLVLGETTHHQD